MKSTQTRFNLIDVIIILLILLIIAAAVIFVVTQNDEAADSGDVHIEYTVRIDGIKNEYLTSIKVGDTVVDSATGKKLGTIIAIRTEKTKAYNTNKVVNENGRQTIPVSYHNNISDVYVTLETSGKYGVNDIPTVSDRKILIGSEIYFKVESFAAVGFITAFTDTPIDK